SHALKKHGYTVGQARDHKSGEPSATAIQYGSGAETDARNVATVLGMDGPIQPDNDLPPGHIRVTVDTNYAMPPVDDTTMDDETSTTTTTSNKASTYGGHGYGSTTVPSPDQGKP